MVDLILPGLKATGVTVDEQDGAREPLRADVDHAKVHVSQTVNRDINAVKIEI